MFTDIQNLFLKDHGSFSKNLQFQTLVIFIVVIIFFTKYFNKTYGFVIILIAFALYLANTYVVINNDKTNDFNSVTMIKLQRLQSKTYEHIRNKIRLVKNTNVQSLPTNQLEKLYKENELDALYIDANLIHFLHSIMALSDYNSELFFSLLKGTNSILEIKRDIDRYYESNSEYPENTSELLESALQIRSNTINNLHNFIYTVPKTSKMYTYINDSIERYNVLISRITDDIHNNYKNNIRLRGVNTTTKFVSYNNTKPFDVLQNHPIQPHKHQNNILQFYV
jgi:hypothetical protein